MPDEITRMKFDKLIHERTIVSGLAIGLPVGILTLASSIKLTEPINTAFWFGVAIVTAFSAIYFFAKYVDKGMLLDSLISPQKEDKQKTDWSSTVIWMVAGALPGLLLILISLLFLS